MGEVLDGWRYYRSKNQEGDCTNVLCALLDSVISDDGWCCPHCNYQEEWGIADTLEKFSDKTIFSLYRGDGDSIKVSCDNCGKNYFIRSSSMIKFSSCADPSF